MYVRFIVYLCISNNIKNIIMSYVYKNPRLINSPREHVEVVKVLFDGKDDPNYSIAIIKWDGVETIGIRWNISSSEWDDPKKQSGNYECIGNPSSRGMSTWFVLPDFFTKDLKETGLLDELLKAKEELRKYKVGEK